MGHTVAVAVIAVLVGHVSGRGMSVHRAGVGVAQRAAIGRGTRKGAFMLGMASSLQAVNRINLRESGGVLLVRRVSVSEF